MKDSFSYIPSIAALTFLSIALLICNICDAVDIRNLKRDVTELKQQIKQLEFKREINDLKAENQRLRGE